MSYAEEIIDCVCIWDVLGGASGIVSYDRLCPVHGDDGDCKRCHGEGEVGVTGYSLSPFSGVMVPDHQNDTWERCPDCGGSGVAQLPDSEGRTEKELRNRHPGDRGERP